MDKVQSYHYASAQPGPRVLFFGTVHGDEVCGYQALSKLQQQLASGELTLRRGAVTLVPLCNPKAYAEKRRFTEENLNRIFKHHAAPKSYEAQLANQLCAVMPGHDYFVDLHSAPDTNKPFAILDYEHPASTALFKMTGLELCLTGWPALFGSSDSRCTTDEAERLGIPALTIECGQHNDSTASEVAYHAVVEVLKHLDMLEGEVSQPGKQQHWHLMHMAIKTDEGRFTRDFEQGDRVCAGDLIVVQDDGTEHHALHDGVLVMPDPNVLMGEAWFYLAEER